MYTLYDSVFGMVETYEELPDEDTVNSDFDVFVSAQHSWTLLDDETGEEVQPA